jgi:hypothetical protein
MRGHYLARLLTAGCGLSFIIGSYLTGLAASAIALVTFHDLFPADYSLTTRLFAILLFTFVESARREGDLLLFDSVTREEWEESFTFSKRQQPPRT